MQKQILLDLLDHNRFVCNATFKKITPENSRFRLNEKTASVGFIYRHIGETANILGEFFGVKTDVENTTIGQSDTGKNYDLQTSHTFMEQGYKTLEDLIKNSSDQDWFEDVETSFLGTVPRMKLLSIILFHNSHHCGQIASAIVKGN
ncbi:DinB family protein [Flavobacterium branchiicola]|uniref:DinB family protein n=1 Tax=Flavobacterium branchiicola TaxID=1114875 RepID=A0ABV9PAH4_9FLAO|nr:DinB family protein [Flavobacterium branchiicola]MBS7252355.1 hypothetical protein [Flavobacterium branchiicola]